MIIEQNNQKFRSERSFSIVLGEKVARMQIYELLGHYHILYVDTKASPIVRTGSEKNWTKSEAEKASNSRERSVDVTMLINHRDKFGAKRNQLVDITMRLVRYFGKWQCHYSFLTLKEDRVTRMYFYIDGKVNGEMKNRNAGTTELWDFIDAQPR